ncbi:hypothetical protein B0J15DRAFT_72451 [Fusarium solani]|uniref:Uncharacterized protein n=1 Tax=Fusarium solani TaxID=169388 RepID=A0A9P9GZU5_FUSSL|nr:uncharacterized protein B0J15DRAFT_72451 [Fusarium solani]KAH7248106.1 hypothetical protein B0J15DRAFT_72451 [Fusarium solani]
MLLVLLLRRCSRPVGQYRVIWQTCFISRLPHIWRLACYVVSRPKQSDILSHGYLSARLNSLLSPSLISFHRSHRSRRKNSSSSPVPVVGSLYSHCFCPVPCPGRLDQLLSRLHHPLFAFYPPYSPMLMPEHRATGLRYPTSGHASASPGASTCPVRL